MMRKGITLTELIVVIGIFGLITTPLARLNLITLRDVSRAYKIVQTNTTILNALQHIKKDVNAATSFPSSHGEYNLNEQTLIIQTDHEVVVYQFNNDQFKRLRFREDSASETTIWSTPRAKIQWKLWQKDNLHALEIKTHIEYKNGSTTDKKMKNTHLFFANNLYTKGKQI
ncbi:MAG: type II secretion system protein [Planctomycetota bacterium]|jgi:type II secretory pathway pseudopilin PulG